MLKAEWIVRFENDLKAIGNKYPQSGRSVGENKFLNDMSQILVHMRNADASILSKMSEINQAKAISKNYFDDNNQLIVKDIPQNSPMAIEILEKYAAFANGYKNVTDAGVLGSFAPPYDVRATSINSYLTGLNNTSASTFTLSSSSK